MAARKNFTVNTPHGLNVRESPSHDAPILRVLADGENVKADAKRNAAPGWIAISGGGYCNAEFLK